MRSKDKHQEKTMHNKCEQTQETIRKNCSNCLLTSLQFARTLCECISTQTQKLHQKAKSCEVKPINIDCQKVKSCLLSPITYLKEHCAGGCEDRFRPCFPCCFKKNMAKVTPIPDADLNKDKEVATRDIELIMDTHAF